MVKGMEKLKSMGEGMNLINLKYHFLKLGRKSPKRAELLCMFVRHYKKLPRSFIEYETAHMKRDRIVFYPLPICKLIVLFFRDIESDRVFSVCRIYTRKREKFYKGKISKIFRFRVNGKMGDENGEED